MATPTNLDNWTTWCKSVQGTFPNRFYGLCFLGPCHWSKCAHDVLICPFGE